LQIRAGFGVKANALSRLTLSAELAVRIASANGTEQVAQHQYFLGWNKYSAILGGDSGDDEQIIVLFQERKKKEYLSKILVDFELCIAKNRFLFISKT
jgi:uncharacterized protein YpmB